MLIARRLTALRIVALVAAVASAVLVVDTLRPGRQFCPLEEACTAAAQSDFGSFHGIPTSVLGLGAFVLVLLVTLLPVRAARFILQPACFVGALAAMSLIAYQLMYLEALCPLCMVADSAAIVMGYIALSWPPLPLVRGTRRLAAESGAARTAWALTMTIAVLAPFVWPRAEDKGWEEAPVVADALFDLPTDSLVIPPAPPPPGATPTPEIAVAAVPPASVDAAAPATEVRTGDAPLGAPPAVTAAEPVPTAAPDRIEAVTAPAVEAAVETATPETPTPEPEAPEPETQRPTPTAAARAPATPTPPEAPAQPAVRVIEYLNAFCAHCRATHARLEKVLAEDGVRVARRRVYTWKGREFPLWARACAYSETLGREDAMFHELTKARRESAGEIYAAAQGVGIDGPAFRDALVQTTPPPRLVRDRRIAQTARLTRLPTFDIGRRRLSGSQSEAELRAALRAAARPTTPTDG